MKKYFIAILALIAFAFAFNADAATTMYGRTQYIGGTASVDNITGYADGDLCLVITSGKVLTFHRYNAASDVAESSPDVIDPDDNGEANGRWELVTGLDMGLAINGDGSITNLVVGGLPDNVVDNGSMADNAIDNAELADDAVTMAELDDDGNFTDWTGNWTFGTGTVTLGDGFTDGTMTLDGSGRYTGVVSITTTGALTIGGAINLGTGGVIFTDDGDGSLTITGDGDGTDEDLTFDFDNTENEVTVTTSTGVTDINFSAINLVTTGTIAGAIGVIETTDGSETVSGSAAYGYLYEADNATAANDTTYTLPAAEIGMSACFYDNGEGTGGVILDPNSADNFILNGLAMANDENLNSPGVAGDGDNGDFICIMAIDATTWVTLGRSGDWVEATPP